MIVYVFQEQIFSYLFFLSYKFKEVKKSKCKIIQMKECNGLILAKHQAPTGLLLPSLSRTQGENRTKKRLLCQDKSRLVIEKWKPCVEIFPSTTNVQPMGSTHCASVHIGVSSEDPMPAAKEIFCFFVSYIGYSTLISCTSNIAFLPK